MSYADRIAGPSFSLDNGSAEWHAPAVRFEGLKAKASAGADAAGR
jgi:hypothetical protein